MSKSQTKASNKYNAKAYDRIAVQVYKGSREIIQAAASRAGESTNAYILGAIDSRMKSEGLDGLPSRAAEVPPAPEVAEIVHEVSEAPIISKEGLTESQLSSGVEVLDLSINDYNMVKRAKCDTVEELIDGLNSPECVLSKSSRAYRAIVEAIDYLKENL